MNFTLITTYDCVIPTIQIQVGYVSLRVGLERFTKAFFINRLASWINADLNNGFIIFKLIWMLQFHIWEVITAVTMKTSVFWIVMPRSSETARCFEGIYRLHRHGQRVSQARNQQKQAENSDCVVPPKRRAVTELHGVTTRKTVLDLQLFVFSYVHELNISVR
jgi:hypothetical protein